MTRRLSIAATSLNYVAVTLTIGVLTLWASMRVAAQTLVDPPEQIGRIEVIDPRMKELVNPAARVEVLAKGFSWTEGPVWHKDGGFLLFSAPRENAIYKWQEERGLAEFLRPSGYTGPEDNESGSGSNGLAIDSQRQLILCQQGDRRLARMTSGFKHPTPEFQTIADSFGGSRFNSPNDLVIDRRGGIYFTDPPYGMKSGWNDESRELDYQGVFYASPEGAVKLISDQLHAPNGIALSPTGKVLYVAQSDSSNAIWMRYDVQPSGEVTNGRILFDATALRKKRPGNPDGLKVDSNGHLFASGPGGVLILTPRGEHLGTIRLDGQVANCAFGDDGSTLYLTAHDRLCRIRLRCKGLGF